MGRFGNPWATNDVSSSGRNEVAENGRCGLFSAGTGTVKHQAARGFGFNKNGVIRAVDGREGVTERDQSRMNPSADPKFFGSLDRNSLANGQKFDDVARLSRRLDDIGGDSSDSLAMDSVQWHGGVESKAGKNRGLLRGIVALDVRGGVRLRITELRRRGERLLEGVAHSIHPVEDEVGRAVDDAENAGDPITGEAVAQGANDGDRTADGCLVVELCSHLFGRKKQFRSVGGQERLIGRHHVSPGVERLKEVCTCRL